MILEHSPNLMKLLPLSCMALGGGCLIGGRFLIFSETSEFVYVYAKTYQEATGDPSFAASSTAIFGILAGAGLAIAGGLVGIIGAFARSRLLYYLFIILDILAALAMISASALYLKTIPILTSYDGKEENYYFVQNFNSPTGFSRIDPVQKGMSDFNNAIFSECCFTRNFTSQGDVPVCTGSVSSCPPITNDVVGRFVTDLSRLCTCFSSEQIKTSYEQIVRNSDVCKIMSTALVDVSDPNLIVPTLGISLRNSIDQTDFRNEKLNNVPLVGYHDSISLFTSKFGDGEPFPKSGFGCGLGFAKGVAWYLSIWHEQHIAPVTQLGFGIGSALLLILILGIGVGYLQKLDSLSGMGSKAELEDIPAPFANNDQPQNVAYVEVNEKRDNNSNGPYGSSMWSAMPIVQQQEVVQQHSNHSSGIQNNGVEPQLMSQTSMSISGARSSLTRQANPSLESAIGPTAMATIMHVPSRHGSTTSKASASPIVDEREVILQKLVRFYAKYDSEKKREDIEDVATWASQNGIAAINQKLMAKYKADLNTMPTLKAEQIEGIGARAGKGTVDV